MCERRAFAFGEPIRIISRQLRRLGNPDHGIGRRNIESSSIHYLFAGVRVEGLVRVLELRRNWALYDLKRVYKKKAMEFHPVGGVGNERKI